jgi:hypothetical protein
MMVRLVAVVFAILAICDGALAAGGGGRSGGIASGTVLTSEPPAGSIRKGVTVFVDDGSCPKGQMKQITGGNDSAGIRRITKCVKK